MNYLLFFISIIFSFIFYIFHLSNTGGTFLGHSFSQNIRFESFSGSILIESIAFFLIGVFLFLGFSSYQRSEKQGLDFSKINKFITEFFKKYLYYIGFIFAYTSIYFIFKSYYITDMSILILFVNIIVFLLFFTSNKFFIFRDFIKVNTILFSIFYIFFYINSFFTGIINFLFIDFVNGVLIFSFFLLTFYNDKKILNKKTDESLLFYFFFYTFLFVSYYLVGFLFNTSFGLSIVSAFLSIFIYYYVARLDFFKGNKILLRSISFIFSYISILISILYLIGNSFNLLIFFVLLYGSYFNFKVHFRFENYISLFLSFVSPIFLIFYFYFKVLYKIDDGFIFLVLSIGVSIEMIVLTYFYKFKYIFDNYFIHIFSYIINIVSLIYYFVVFEFDFFVMGVILFFETILVFSSYYKLKQTNNLLNE